MIELPQGGTEYGRRRTEAASKARQDGRPRGGGRPPGYQWGLEILDLSTQEARGFLSDTQYSHVAQQFRQLCREDEPTTSALVGVRPIDDFHELRDKGGPLGRINVRVFFFVHHERRNLVILGCINKKNDGSTPLGDVRRMARRKRLYLETLT